MAMNTESYVRGRKTAEAPPSPQFREEGTSRSIGLPQGGEEHVAKQHTPHREGGPKLGGQGGPSVSLPMADENSVVRKAKAERARVFKLEPDSPAAVAGVRVGDVVTHVDGQPVLDIVDWAFLTAGEKISITVDRPEVGPLTLTLRKDYDEDPGMEFGDDLFDRVHICKNKCVFCFLYQQPKGLRPSLYIKDDDYRLSFLHGNYLTLTNMGEDEFARVIAQRLSPLFVSVHATDPEVRGRMLGRKGPEAILPRLRMLADAGIQTHCQVVLCPGYNDGPVLEQTVRELAALHPAADKAPPAPALGQGQAPPAPQVWEEQASRLTVLPQGGGEHVAKQHTPHREGGPQTWGAGGASDGSETHFSHNGGVLSVAVVPVGLTQFRDRLAALKTCDPEFDRALLAQADGWRKEYRRTLDTNFVFLSDEFYLNAGRDVPSASQYEGFAQLEDGVGLVRQFQDDLKRVRKRLPSSVAVPRTATLATGTLAAPLLHELAETFNTVKGLSVNVCAVHNTFFEGNIGVAGLITGGDLARALNGMEGVGERVLVPAIMLRDPDRDVFLDDMTLPQFSALVGREVVVVDRTPSAAARALLN